MRNLLGALLEGVFIQQLALGFELRRQAVHKSLVIRARHQFILAARKKLDEVAQELSGFREPPVLVQLQPRHVPAQQDPVVHLLQRPAVWFHLLQQRFAEGMKRRQRHRFPALARGLHHARFHLPGGFLRECQPEDIFAGEAFKAFIRLQQVPDTLGNDARLSSPRAGNHEQRTFAVRDRAPLRVIQLQPAIFQRLHLKQCRHDSRRVSDFKAKRKRTLAVPFLAH